MTAHDWLDMAAAYALGSLDSGDRVDFEQHLRECTECQRAVESYRNVTVSLADGVPRTSPPSHLRNEILTRIRSEAAPAGAETRSADGSDTAPTRRPTLRFVLMGATAASLVAAVMTAVMLQRSRAEVASLERALTESQAELADSSRTVAGQQTLLDVLLAPELSTASLATAAPETPSLQLFLNRTSNVLVVAAFSLTPAPQGQTYQLWGITGNEPPVSLGLFDVASDNGPVTLTAAATETFEVAAVTVEPANGSPQPTSAPFLVGAWYHGN